MPKQDKVLKLEEIQESLKGTNGLVLANFKGMSVLELEDLRKKIEKDGGSAKVVKNKLLKKALEGANIGGMEAYLKENTLMVMSQDDILKVLKVVVDYSKTNDKFALKAGYLDGMAFDKQGVIAMSNLPSRKDLLSMVVGNINGVIANFVGTLNGVMTTFIGTVEALEKKKEN